MSAWRSLCRKQTAGGGQLVGFAVAGDGAPQQVDRVGADAAEIGKLELQEHGGVG